MKIVHKLEMDLAQRDEIQRIDVVQGDSNTRVLELTLCSNAVPWEPPETVSIWMRYCKSDGTKGVYDTLPDGTGAWNREGNVIRIDLVPQMFTVSGMVMAQVVLIDAAAELATFSVQIHVERNPAVGSMESEDYMNMLQWMDEELENLLAKAKDSGQFDGPQGPRGPEGPQGPQGEDAGTIFDYMVDAGYSGTEEELQERLMTPCLPLGGGSMQGEVNMDGYALTGLAIPQADSDAATKAYIDNRLQIQNALLKKTSWSAVAPYKQTISLIGVSPRDYIKLTPSYTNEYETDLLIKEAWPCISYAYGGSNMVVVICLEEKPTINVPVVMEIIR